MTGARWMGISTSVPQSKVIRGYGGMRGVRDEVLDFVGAMVSHVSDYHSGRSWFRAASAEVVALYGNRCVGLALVYVKFPLIHT